MEAHASFIGANALELRVWSMLGLQEAMHSTLVVIAGPLSKDTSISLLDEEVSIGRDLTNAVSIAMP
jgi:hypothetical protein